jgi:hypothetical protein
MLYYYKSELASAMATVKEGSSYIHVKGNRMSTVSAMDASCSDIVRFDLAVVPFFRGLMVAARAIFATALVCAGVCRCCEQYTADYEKEKFNR